MLHEPVPISALQHYSYCPRQYALIHLEQVFEDNAYTLRGQAVHQRVDQPSDTTPLKGIRQVRSLQLFHEDLGLIGKADMVEFLADGTPYPVEYKHGPRRKRLHDDIQLAAQALCLEHMTGLPVPEGAVYHASSKKRRVVAIDAMLRQHVLVCLAGVRSVMQNQKLPPPATDNRCRNCSLVAVCEPSVFADYKRLQSLRAKLFTDLQPD